MLWDLVNRNRALFDLEGLDVYLVMPLKMYIFLVNFIKIALILHLYRKLSITYVLKILSFIPMLLV